MALASAGAIIHACVTKRAPEVTPARFTEDPGEENHHGMLREKERATTPGDSRTSGQSID
jgi:hypothetical protein